MDKKYHYIHTVSYWTGNKRNANLAKQARKVKSLKTPKEYKNLLVVSILDDNTRAEPELIEIIHSFRSSRLDVVCLINYNSGGTVRSMQYSWEYCKSHDIESEYFGCWEDDYCFLKATYLEDIKPYLDKYLFVGSLWKDDWFDQDPKGFLETGQKKFINGIDLGVAEFGQHEKHEYSWCEDPYVMRFDNIQKIENLIKDFTLADKDEKYTHEKHGIALGEVGFPTRLKLAGGNFFGLSHEDYYTFLNTDSLTYKRINEQENINNWCGRIHWPSFPTTHHRQNEP